MRGDSLKAGWEQLFLLGSFGVVLLLLSGSDGDGVVGDDLGSLFAHEIGLDSGGIDGCLDLVKLHLILLGELLELFFDLFVGDFEVLGAGNFTQQDVRADGLLCHRAHGLTQAAQVAADHLGVVFHLHALGLKLVGELLDLMVDLLVDHAGGNIAS